MTKYIIEVNEEELEMLKRSVDVQYEFLSDTVDDPIYDSQFLISEENRKELTKVLNSNITELVLTSILRERLSNIKK